MTGQPRNELPYCHATTPNGSGGGVYLCTLRAHHGGWHLDTIFNHSWVQSD